MFRPRSNTVDSLLSFADGDNDLSGPTSTTKALLINIVCPRRIGHTTAVPEKEQEELLDDGNQGGQMQEQDTHIPSTVVDTVVNDVIIEEGEDEVDSERIAEKKIEEEENESYQDEKANLEPSSSSSPTAGDATPKLGNSKKSVTAERPAATSQSSLPAVAEEGTTTSADKVTEKPNTEKLFANESDLNDGSDSPVQEKIQLTQASVDEAQCPAAPATNSNSGGDHNHQEFWQTVMEDPPGDTIALRVRIN